MSDQERCPAKIRPFMPMRRDVALQCEQEEGHAGIEHQAHLYDHAYPGSSTLMVWGDDDRRNFTSDFATCPVLDGCILPAGHRGECAL